MVVVPPLYDRFGTSLFFSWLCVSVVVVWRWFFFLAIDFRGFSVVVFFCYIK